MIRHSLITFSALLLAVSARSEGTAGAPPADQVAAGKAVYMAVCFACHQPTGLGIPGVFPPLSKSDYVNGSPERFAAMILKGNLPPMTVDGKVYAAAPMPPQELVLTDEKVAAVMTYVRSSFGNSSAAVGPEVVAATRKKFADRKTSWTEAELKVWKDDAAVPAK